MDNKIQLKEGEVVCNKCQGTCLEPNSNDNVECSKEICSRCLGHGKLDWIENIIGKVRNILSANWSFSSSVNVKTIFSHDIEKELMETLAKEIAKDIDEQILKEIIKDI